MPFSKCFGTKSGGYKNLINKLRQDHLSGASELSRKASQIFISFSQEVKAVNSKDYLDKLLKLCQDVISSQPYIVPIFNLSNSIIAAIEKEKSSSVKELKELTKTKALQFYEGSLTSLDRIGDYGQRWIKNDSTILTLSFSGSVFSIFKKAKESGKDFRVMVCESRPLLEGKKLAIVLRSLGIETTLMVDAAMGLFLDKADLILLGADCVTGKFFVNKIGSYALCLLAREKKVPVYVACEKRKFIPERFRIKCKPIGGGGSISEVYKRKIKNVKIENPYFENVRISLCKRIITEEGIFISSEVKEVLSKVKINRRFQNLIKI